MIMGFWGWIIVLFITSIICRIIRSRFEAIDWIVYLLVFVVAVFVWIFNGFWMGLLALIVGSIAATLLFGMGGGTKVNKFGHNYTLECDSCGYDKLDIIEHTELGVITRCPRCKRICHHTLNH
ncbi:MAG: hypothetical protein J6V33_04720 [Bacteroidales bacterium]|nr:hypothetical protein [Bacteroidales bacterium]